MNSEPRLHWELHLVLAKCEQNKNLRMTKHLNFISINLYKNNHYSCKNYDNNYDCQKFYLIFFTFGKNKVVAQFIVSCYTHVVLGSVNFKRGFLRTLTVSPKRGKITINFRTLNLLRKIQNRLSLQGFP